MKVNKLSLHQIIVERDGRGKIAYTGEVVAIEVCQDLSNRHVSTKGIGKSKNIGLKTACYFGEFEVEMMA